MAKAAQQAQQPAQQPQQASPQAVSPTQAPSGFSPMSAQPMVNPTQAPAGVNPMAQQQMANPQQGLMGLPAKPPVGGIASVPMAMFNSQSYAGGGIIAFDGGGDVGEKEAQAYYAKQNPQPSFFGFDVSNPPAESPKDQRILRQVFNNFASGNLAPPPPNFNPNAPVVTPATAPTAIPSTSPQSLSGQPVEEPAQPIASPVNAPLPEGVTDTGINVGTTRPTPAPEGIATIATTPSVPTRAPVSAQPSATPSAGLPSVAKPATDPFAVQTPEEAFAERRKLQEMAGVSKDPYAAVMQRQAAMEARDQAKYAQDPLDRVLAQLSAISTADPTKGAGYALGVSAKTAQEMKDKQTDYRDKKEQIGLEFATNMAKEKDARARGDVAGVEAAITAQKKNKIDLAKVEVDKLGHQLSYQASMASTGNAANTLAFQKEQAAIMNPYNIKEKEALAKQYESNVTSKDEKARMEKERITDKRVKDNLSSLTSTFTELSKYTDPIAGLYKFGTPAGNAILQYQQDLQNEARRAGEENRPPKYPPPPVQVEEIIKKGHWPYKDETTKSLNYGQSPAPTSAPSALPPKPAAYPDAKLGTNRQGKPAWIVEKNGQLFEVQQRG
jgi:hypothetical protein